MRTFPFQNKYNPENYPLVNVKNYNQPKPC